MYHVLLVMSMSTVKNKQISKIDSQRWLQII